MKKNRPVIAVTHSSNESKIVILLLKFIIWFSGGKFMGITVHQNAQIFQYQGLILYGGTDINPTLYHQLPKPGYHYDNERDALELQHLAVAEKKDIPVLGICRGCQLINIYRKGTLHLDIVKAYEKIKYPSHLLGFIVFRKRIYIRRKSKLFFILKTTTIKVNSLHRQAIRHLGKNLKITASEENHIVQCIEDSKKSFYLGVQFHPEFLIHRACFRNIFKILISSTKANI